MYLEAENAKINYGVSYKATTFLSSKLYMLINIKLWIIRVYDI